MINSLYDKFKPWSANGSIYIISDTHFDDSDCKLMNPEWIPAKDAADILKKNIHKSDTLIHLGDVGDATYLDQLKCYKVLITGNHDILGKISDHFDEIYTGPLFIADRILLSHEPIYGLEEFCINIHGHVHNGIHKEYNMLSNSYTHINMASDVCNFMPIDLGKEIKNGLISNIPNYHRITIDNAILNPIKE